MTNKTSAQLVSDILSGNPIILKAYTAVYNGDDKLMDTVTDKSGYTVTHDELVAAINAVQSGKDFDIRAVGGLYDFTKPSDLVGKKMMVNPATAKIEIDDVAKANKTTSTGEVTWTDGSYTYTIVFKVTYNTDGSPAPTTFSGSRVKSGSSKEDVAGEQILVTPHWTGHDISLTAAFVATVLGFGIGAVGLAIADWSKAKKWYGGARAKLERKSAREELETTAYNPPQIDFKDFRDDVESSIAKSVLKDLRKPLDPVTDIEVIRANASEAASAKLKKSAYAIIRPNFHENEDIARLLPVALSPDVETSKLDSALKLRLGTRLNGLSAAADYLTATVEITIDKKLTIDAQHAGTKYHEAADQATQDAANYEAQKVEKQKALDDRITALREAGRTEDQINKDADVIDLRKQVAELEKKEKAKEKEAGDNTTKEAEAEQKAKDEAEKERKAREKADGAADHIYGDGL